MSKEKQIEEIDELETVLYEANHKKSVLDYRWLATEAYNIGYRKQSKGEWIRNIQTSEYICSLCGAIGPVDCLKEDFYESNYCPNCGAKMKGGAI